MSTDFKWLYNPLTGKAGNYPAHFAGWLGLVEPFEATPEVLTSEDADQDSEDD